MQKSKIDSKNKRMSLIKKALHTTNDIDKAEIELMATLNITNLMADMGEEK